MSQPELELLRSRLTTEATLAAEREHTLARERLTRQDAGPEVP